MYVSVAVVKNGKHSRVHAVGNAATDTATHTLITMSFELVLENVRGRQQEFIYTNLEMISHVIVLMQATVI